MYYRDMDIKRLGDIAKISSGSTPARNNQDFWNGDIPWVSTGELSSGFVNETREHVSLRAVHETSLKLLKPGTLLMAMYGQGKTRGIVSRLNITATTNQACASIEIKKDEPSYVYYFLQFRYESIRKLSNGGSQENLSTEIIKKIKISLPPIAEQRKIAEILSAQDRVIELKTKLLEEKKRLKKYLCQVLISGESQSEGKKILFKELFEFLNNNSCSRAQMKEKGTIYNVHYGDILTKYGELLDAKKDEVPCICVNINLSKCDRLQNGDIVFADTAEDLLVGKSTELKNVGNKHIIAGLHTIAARPIKDCFIPGWLGYYTNSPSYRRQLYTCAQGSKVISILRKDIIDTIVDVPDKTIQKKVVTVLDIISDEIKKIRIVIEQEKLKKKALMQQLLTGKVRVSV